MKRHILILLACVLCLSSCSDYEKIRVNSYRIGGIDNFALQKGQIGTTVRLCVNIENPTNQKIVVKSVDAVLYEADGDVFADITSNGEVEIAPLFCGEAAMLLGVKMKSFHPISMFMTVKDFAKMTADFDVRVKCGIFTKTIRRKGVPVSSLMSRAGAKTE